MTERLVDKNPCVKCERNVNCGSCTEPDAWMNQIKNKLAVYETAEREGRMVILPCKIGTPVYVIRQGWNGWNIDKKKFNYGMLDKVGKTVFLTPEKAEKVLARKKSE